MDKSDDVAEEKLIPRLSLRARSAGVGSTLWGPGPGRARLGGEGLQG